jgi:putative membrane protein
MRVALFTLGIASLALVWFGPLPRLAPGAFSAHMIMHMGVVALAAPLIALGVARGRYDPVRRVPRLFAPLPASVVELIAVWAWHAPGLHHFARNSAVGLVLEQGTFLFSGLLVWLAAFGGEPEERGERIAQGGLALLLTSMHMTLLGALLALPPRALYAHSYHTVHGGHVDPTWSLSPIEDQHLGGAIMLVAGGVAYLAGGLALTVELLRSMRASDSPRTPARWS